MDSTLQKDATTEGSLVSSATDRAVHNGVPPVGDPMVLTHEVMQYLVAHCFSIESIKSLLAKHLDINAKHEIEGWNLSMGLVIYAIHNVNEVGEAKRIRESYQFMISQGADVHAKLEGLVTNIIIAKWSGNEYVYNIVSEAMHTTEAKNGIEPNVSRLVQDGAKIMKILGAKGPWLPKHTNQD